MLTPRWLGPAGFGLLFILVASAWVQAGAPGPPDFRSLGGGLVVLALYALTVRSGSRVAATVASVLMPVAVVALTMAAPYNVGWFVLVLFAGFVALTLPFAVGIAAWAVAMLVLLVMVLAVPDLGWPNWLAGVSVTFWGGWAARYRIEVSDRLHRAEAAAQETESLAERQRLAADLHDIVAHTLAVTVLHLGGARLALAHDPDEAETTIAEAERLARQSMTEVRRVVRVLAEGEAVPVNGVDAPQPTAGRLPELFEEYRSAGLALSIEITGDLSEVSPATGMVVYRLAQEALANASRHAPGLPVEVELRVTEDGAVNVSVTNPATTRNARGEHGMGLRAMTDRVRMLGGDIIAGPDGDRWVVRAELPA